MRSPEVRFRSTSGNLPGLFPLRKGLLYPAEFRPEAASYLDGTKPPDPIGASDEPFVGITTDGTVVPGLFQVADEGIEAGPIVDAARAFLDAVADKAAVHLPMDSPAWRHWTNAYLAAGDPLHGLLLEDATPAQRDAAMAVMAASLSDRGYRMARGAMHLNAWLGEYIQEYLDTLTEWLYWFAVFGQPSVDEPWGWQLWGHHLDISCVVVGRQLVLTPAFVGAEPAFAPDGTCILAEERAAGFAMFDALRPDQRQRATLYPSMLNADLPKELAGPVDGRHLGGAGQDNRVIPYEGIRGDELTVGQRAMLLAVAEPYIDRMPRGSHAAKRVQVERHLDETRFAWIGGDDPDGPYYYRVHSPVVLIEYDNHPGVFLNNPEPEPFHIHTIVRTPNGGDYGKDLLRQHYAVHHRGTSRASSLSPPPTSASTHGGG